MLAGLKSRLLMNPNGWFGRVYLGPAWNKRNIALNEAALLALQTSDGNRVLEVGFGGGYLLKKMAETFPTVKLTGVDASPSLVEAAQRNLKKWVDAGRLSLICAKVEGISLPDAAFDRVVSVNSLFYWPQPKQALAEIRRVLTPGGLLVLCITDKESLMEKNFHRHGIAVYDENDLRALLASAGFVAIKVETMADKHRRFLRAVASS